MRSSADSVDEYLESLPEERWAAVAGPAIASTSIAGFVARVQEARSARRTKG